MFVIEDEVRVRAPVERCFLLSTSLALVERELKMRPVAGEWTAAGGERRPLRTEGLAVGGDHIRWQGWQLGMPQVHESLISAYEVGRYFQDRMVEGRFKTFEHNHWFEEVDGVVVMRDQVRFSMPLGAAGWLVGKVVMVPHIRGLLRRRFKLLKRIAESESEEWKHFVPFATLRVSTSCRS